MNPKNKFIGADFMELASMGSKALPQRPQKAFHSVDGVI